VRLKPIDEQVVVVFGASSGIGRGAALRLAAAGARVVVAARDSDGLDSLVSEIRGAGGEATPVVADAAVFHQVKDVADRAVQEYGRLDTWVHTAAVSLYATFEETSPEEFARVIDVNLLGAAHGAMVALPHIRREGRGALIFVSSGESLRSLPLQSAYAASKQGLIGFLDALRLELMAEGVPISVTTVLPASTNTPLFDKARSKLGVKPRGFPPIYDPSIAVDAIVYAASHPTRDIVAGGAARMLSGMNVMSRSMTDRFLAATAFELQRTAEPKPPDGPGNLFEPVAGLDKVEGSFGEEARPNSAVTWWQMHPAARRAAMAGVGAGLALGIAAAVSGSRSRSMRRALSRRLAAISAPIWRVPMVLSRPIPRLQADLSRMADRTRAMVVVPSRRVLQVASIPVAFALSRMRRRRQPPVRGWAALGQQLVSLMGRAPIARRRRPAPRTPVEQARQYVVDWVGSLQRR
jgi:NAD(P)-dependent dehydrogenase (short-subunit alcohol dehydrogenase family)